MKQVLVTGSGGQLGMCIQKIAGKFPEIEFSFETKDSLDISSEEQVKALFNEKDFEYCINCAAYTKVDLAEKETEKAFLINATAVKNLAHISKETGTTLIHISTDYVFDGSKKEGYYPNDPPNPINAYGKSKLQGEIYIRELLASYVIIRTSWLYSEFGENFYKTVLRKAKKGEDLYITDEQLGCPTNANNLANYILEHITEGVKWEGLFHFTDGEPMSWYGFANKIVEDHNLKSSVNIIKSENYRSLAKRPAYSILLQQKK